MSTALRAALDAWIVEALTNLPHEDDVRNRFMSFGNGVTFRSNADYWWLQEFLRWQVGAYFGGLAPADAASVSMTEGLKSALSRTAQSLRTAVIGGHLHRTVRDATRSYWLTAFVSHPHCVLDPFGYELATLDAALPGSSGFWSFDLFREAAPEAEPTEVHRPRDDGRRLRKGFDMRHAPAFARIAGDETLWSAEGGRSTRVSCMRALVQLARIDPAGTFDGRLGFMRRAIEKGDEAYDQFEYVYAFEEEGDHARLAQVKETADRPLANRIDEILSGRFHGVLWAI